MLQSSAAASITTDMAQNRLMAILLFVCLSLCSEVAQSQLKKDGNPCVYSDDCDSRCCFWDSPKGSGKCVQKSLSGVRCYGSKEGDPCFHSDRCNSGCCVPRGSMYNAVCVTKHDQKEKCLGSNIGDFCYSSRQCRSGCCSIELDHWFSATCSEGTDRCLGSYNKDFCTVHSECKSGCCRAFSTSENNSRGKCGWKGREDNFCNPATLPGLQYYCPCQRGLVCEMGTSLNETNPVAMLLKKLFGKHSKDFKINACKKPQQINVTKS